MKKLTSEEYISRATEKHNGVYDYSKIKYTKMKDKIKIKCKIHGFFEIDADSHLYKGYGCFQCKGKRMGNVKDKLKFLIKRANEIHNNTYDYSLIKKYNGVMKKEPIKCHVHGVWEVSLDNHINKKSKCPKCRGRDLNKEERIKLVNEVHNNKYDYSLLPLNIKNKRKYEIICPHHGIFSQTWTNHFNMKQGCPECNPCGRKKRTIEDLKEQTILLNTGYEYRWESFVGYFDPLEIKCDKHGWFKQSIANHLFGQRCPNCVKSFGEEKINSFFISNNIKFERQKRFDDCINPLTNRKLKFDFYIPFLNACIEYDGELHFKAVEHFGGEKSLNNTIYLDSLKNKYCFEKNIKLLRISYLDFKNIESILKKFYEI